MFFLERLRLDDELLWRLEHAAGEAIADFVEQESLEGYFELRVRLIGSAIRIEVEGARSHYPGGTPLSQAIRGFSIAMMRSLVDGVAFFKNGRVVRLETWLTQSQMQALPRSQRTAHGA